MFLLKPLNEKLAAAIAMAAALLTLAFDFTQPLGIAAGMPYVVLPLFGLLARSPRIAWVSAAVGTSLTVAGLAVSVGDASHAMVMTNRAMSIVLLWVVAGLTVRHLSVGHALRTRLREQALTDPLTGLYNRRHVFACIDSELERFARYAETFSVILIDVDHFKQVNDNYGHGTGDATLRLIARVCTAAIRETDIVGRFGGEEFIILLPHTKAADAAVLAERIRKDIGAVSRELLDGAALVTLSFGVAEVTPGIAGFNKLLAAADKALYDAKNSGRDRVAVWRGASEQLEAVDAA